LGRSPKPPADKAIARPDAPTLDSEVTKTVLDRIDDLVPEENRARVAVIIEETISEISHHSGPLPRPADLAGYEAIQKGFAERIMQMAEKEQDGRLSSFKNVIEKDYNLKSRGQHYALLIAVVLVAFAGLLAHLGDTESAAWVAGGGIAGVVGIFVTGRFISARESKNKMEDEV
jgi:uncharacterized membrane protein